VGSIFSNKELGEFCLQVILGEVSVVFLLEKPGVVVPN
jgi:hypothetical protein